MPRGLVPSVFKAFGLLILDWKLKFIFIHVSFFSNKYPGIVTPFRHRLGTFSFPYPSEPLDVSLRARLTHFPIEPCVFLDAILYLADLAPLWEGHLCIQLFLLMVEMTFRDFLQYPGNHHISVAAVPFSVSVSGRNSADLTVEASEGGYGGSSIFTWGRFGSSGSGSAGFIGPLATSEENLDSYSFLPGLNFLVCKQIRIGTVLKFDFLRSTCACKWLLEITRSWARSVPLRYDMICLVLWIPICKMRFGGGKTA
ncbi:hypothetical protein Tco_0701555 [Tanacetum coccineum]